jgi:HK97 gp10 family phage protein
VTDTKVKGLAELQRAMDSLPAKIEANIMRGALRAGAKVIAEEARANLARNGSVDSGRLEDSVRVGTRLKRGTAIGRVIAGGSSKGKAAAFYAGMVERGTAAHVIPGPVVIGDRVVGDVDHPGAQKKPFLRPAIDTKAGEAVVAMREYIRARLSSKHGIDVPTPTEEGDE